MTLSLRAQQGDHLLVGGIHICVLLLLDSDELFEFPVLLVLIVGVRPSAV